MKGFKEKVYYSTLKTHGIFIRVFSDGEHIIRIELNKSGPGTKEELCRNANCIKLQKDDPYMLGAVKQLEEYFAGERKTFDLPLKYSGTEYQMKVWNELKKIPYGKVVSYKEIAERTGNAAAVRAIGRINGANPIPVIIPCHRVINANGKLGGYSGGGVEVKLKLLELEGYLDSELFEDE
jgi:methylated-DNA-[protein]-cysteine S-methyltransferase